MSMVSKRCSVCQHAASSIRSSAHSGWMCISNGGTPPSCVPDARRAVPTSRRAGLGACATLPILERPVLLWLHLRRFECHECHHRPWETSETFGARVKWTERLYHQVRAEVLGGCPGRELARRYGLSARTVFRWTFERSRGGRPRRLGRVIGIDAYSRRKGHRYNTLIVDLDKGQPIVTFKGRRADEVVAWFRSRPQEELAGVEVVVL